MLVSLKRNLVLADRRYRDFGQGVEIPDQIDGKKVVPYDKRGEVPGKFWVLPKDAVILTEAPAPPLDLKDDPVALSQIAQAAAKPQSFQLAMRAKK